MQPYEQLEVEIGKWMGYPAENVVVTSSGTAALHLALEALRLPLGSQVVLADYCMVACARTVTLAGLQPVFADVDERLCLCPDEVDRIGERYEAIMPVHTFGRRCDMDALAALARKYNLYVVEDLAEAHGVKPHPQTDAACWSFYKNKIVAGEEGGAVAFRAQGTATLARSLRSLGFTEAHDFQHIPRGHNYRLANALATPILRRLRLWSQPLVIEPDGQGMTYVERRREIESWYNEACPVSMRMPPRDAPWVYDIRIPGGRDNMTRIVKALQEAGIQARHGFYPMTCQVEYQQQGTGCNVRSAKAAECVMYLPVQPGVTTREDCEKAFEIIERTQ